VARIRCLIPSDVVYRSLRKTIDLNRFGRMEYEYEYEYEHEYERMST